MSPPDAPRPEDHALPAAIPVVATPSGGGAASSGKDRWEKADILVRLLVALWALPAFAIVQGLTARNNHRQEHTQAATFESHKRLAAAELAKGLLPMLVKEGRERAIAFKILAWVVPEQVGDLLTALESAGEPVAPRLAAEVRRTGRLRALQVDTEAALAEARARRTVGNDAEAYRILRAALNRWPPDARARADAAGATTAAGAYQQGQHALAALTLETATRSVTTHSHSHTPLVADHQEERP